MATKRLLGALVILGLIITLFWGDSLVAPALSGGLQNPGFEDGLVNGAPKYWTVNSAPDAAIVVDAEDPSKFPTYVNMGNVTVQPFKGNLMLRLGTPKTISQKQNVGDNTVSQLFTANHSTLQFAFRLFSWEEHGQDVFQFKLTGPTSTLLVTGAPNDPRLPGGCANSSSSLVCRYSIDVGKQKSFLDTNWQVVTITGLVSGQSYTISYTTGGSKDSSHATWAYFDNANTPPVAKFDFAPAQPLEGGVI